MMHFNFESFLLLIMMVESVNAEVYDRYAGYEPTTMITDYAAIDLDQEIVNEKAGNHSLENAWAVYTQGGHSGSYAELKITNTTTAAEYPAGTIVRGLNSFRDIVNGTLLEAASWRAGASSPAIKVLYDVLPLQSEYSDCQSGGLYILGAAERGGCFLDSGSIHFAITSGVSDKEFGYTYDNRAGNKNIHTLQKLSTNASSTMKGPDGSFFPEFKVFHDYYGDTNYGDKWVSAARNMTATNFTSGRGNSNFTLLSNRDGQGEVMSMGSVYLNVWMEVVRYLNEAVIDCRDNVTDTASIDKVVAYYAGSRITEVNDVGVLLYELAEIRAHQMKTNGHLEDKEVGDAFVNVDVFRHLTSMKEALLSDNATSCDQVQSSKDYIVTMMRIPMVQSVLRCAYIQEKEPPTTQEEVDVWVAKGAIFAATMLPFLHQCDSRVAEVVHSHMKLGVIAKYDEVKTSMESTYTCLNVTCEHIGGVWDYNGNFYKSSPCGVSAGRSAFLDFIMLIGISSVIAIALL